MAGHLSFDERVAVARVYLRSVRDEMGEKERLSLYNACGAELLPKRFKPSPTMGAARQRMKPEVMQKAMQLNSKQDADALRRKAQEQEGAVAAAVAAAAAAPAPAEAPPPAVEPFEPEPMPTGEDLAVAWLTRVATRFLSSPELRVTLRELLVASLGDAAQQRDDKLPEAFAPRPKAPVTVGYKRLPRVVILTNDGRYSETLYAAYNDRCHLGLWTTDQRIDRLRSMLKACDVAVVFVRFLPHMATHAVRDSKVQVIMNPNGMTTGRALIDHFLDTWVPPDEAGHKAPTSSNVIAHPAASA